MVKLLYSATNENLGLYDKKSIQNLFYEPCKLTEEVKLFQRGINGGNRVVSPNYKFYLYFENSIFILSSGSPIKKNRIEFA